MANSLNYKCPACGDEDHIDVAASTWVRLTEDGSDAALTQWGDQEYHPYSPAACRACDYTGRLDSFEPEPEPLTLLAALQQALTALNTAPRFAVPALDTTSYKIAALCEAAITAATAEQSSVETSGTKQRS